MLLAERYIFRRILALSLMTLGSLTMVVLITQVLIYVNVVTDSGEAILTFLNLALMLVPAMVNVVLPFALLIAACQTLNTMHTDSEVVVLEAAGTSPSVMAKPIMALALLMSGVMLVNSLVVEPAANRKLRDIINTAGSNLVKLAVQSGSFHRLEDGLYIQIAGQLPNGEFEGIVIADMREPTAELIYYARRGSIQQNDGLDVLVMANGEVHRKNAQSGEVSIITFQSYALDFTHFGPASGMGNYFPKERPTGYLLSPDPDDRIFQSIPHAFRMELHRRLSEWLYPIAFGVIAVYFSAGARTNREERLWSLAAAASIALAFRGIGFLVVESSGTSLSGAIATYALPLSCIAIFGGMMLAGKRGRISQAWMEWTSAQVTRLWHLGDLALRRIGVRRGLRAGGSS